MNLLDFIFRLGVLFAIYGFLWGLIEVGIWILSQGRKRSLGETYLIKAIKYFFLADVTFLFSIDGADTGLVKSSQVIFAGIILLTYFIGKLQKNQNRSMFMKFAGRNMPQQQSNFHMVAEVTIISLSLVIFALFWFYPGLSLNPVSHWFRESIINIEDTPVFGFIFKVIGFFFLLSLIFKMAAAFGFVLSGGRNPRNDSNGGPKGGPQPRSENDFDDYEEIN